LADDPKWIAACFAPMQRNSVHLSDYSRLPSDAVVEIERIPPSTSHSKSSV
jgi:hypothetical protein